MAVERIRKLLTAYTGRFETREELERMVHKLYAAPGSTVLTVARDCGVSHGVASQILKKRVESDQGNEVAGMSNGIGAPLGRCGGCSLWVRQREGDFGWKIGLGRCSNVPKFYDAMEPSDQEGEDGNGYESLKLEYESLKAFALDGSGYVAELLTKADFGCVQFVPKSDMDA